MHRVHGIPTVGRPDLGTGTVLGQHATDPDNDTLTYSRYRPPHRRGTPDRQPRRHLHLHPHRHPAHSAAMTVNPVTTDSFTATINDGHGGTDHHHRDQRPPSTPPTVHRCRHPDWRPPDAVTGTVLGQLHATDPDDDTLTYSGTDHHHRRGQRDRQPRRHLHLHPHPAARLRAGSTPTPTPLTASPSPSPTATAAAFHTPITVSVTPAQRTPRRHRHHPRRQTSLPVWRSAPTAPAPTSPTTASDTVSVIDTATNTVTATITVGDRPARGGGQPRRHPRLRHQPARRHACR